MSTTELYKDAQGNRWFAFDDLFTLPFIRHFAAKKIIDLYGSGLSIEDVRGHTQQLKALLRSNDAEKYEKAYAEVLRIEQLADTMADPVKQSMGLCTVYLLLNDEQVDVYSQATVNVKMTLMAADLQAQAFFLRWWTDIIQSSGRVLKGLSKIASMTIPS